MCILWVYGTDEPEADTGITGDCEKVVDGDDIYARIDGQWKMIQEAKR